MKNYDLVMCITQNFSTTYWISVLGFVLAAVLGYWAGYLHSSFTSKEGK